jgi:hypothetical protein
MSSAVFSTGPRARESGMLHGFPLCSQAAWKDKMAWYRQSTQASIDNAVPQIHNVRTFEFECIKIPGDKNGRSGPGAANGTPRVMLPVSH